MNGKDLFNIEGKKAIVTGGTRGLGYGMAEGLMEAGCEVAIKVYRSTLFLSCQRKCSIGTSCSRVYREVSTKGF